jgi:hypothetical protein
VVSSLFYLLIDILIQRSNIPSKISNDSSLTVLRSQHMGLQFSRRQFHLSNGSSNLSTRALINPKVPWLGPPQARFLMHLGNCQVPLILRIPKANTRFREVSIGMHSILKPNLSFPAILAFQFLNPCHIMDLLTTGRHITAPHISLTMPSLHHNNMVMEWVIAWQGRVRITLCRLIMHLLTWHIDL